MYFSHVIEELSQAFDLIGDFEATATTDIVLKAVVFSILGQQNNDSNLMEAARRYFASVGASPNDCGMF